MNVDSSEISCFTCLKKIFEKGFIVNFIFNRIFARKIAEYISPGKRNLFVIFETNCYLLFDENDLLLELLICLFVRI